MTDDELLALYDAGFQAKLDEIRQRPRDAAVVPYEAHIAGLRSVRAEYDAAIARLRRGGSMPPEISRT